MVHSRLVYGEDERVAKWCQERLPNFIGWNGYYTAIGYERRGELKAGVVYTNYSRANVVTSIVLEIPISRRFLFAVLYYPFMQLNTRRITAMVDARNEKSLRFCKHVGFSWEGLLREGAIDGGDVVVMGMLKRECRWL